MKTKIYRHLLIVHHHSDGLWDWHVLLWLGPGVFEDVALKSVQYYPTEKNCRKEANKLLVELGIMNKNTKRRKTENPGSHQPRKSTKPKVGSSAAEITRRIAKERS